MKQLVRAAFRHFGLQVTRIPPSRPDPERDYVTGGRIPWSRGYNEAKQRLIREAVANPSLLALFHQRHGLPEQFGVGIDERCVEYPWLFAHLRSEPEIVLDAGSALNHDFVLEHPILSRKTLHIMTLAPEANCFWEQGISYLFQDLRHLPMRDSYYDTIACLSTLEHVGFNNSFHTGRQLDQECAPKDFILAMRELSRVLKSNGTLFLTVPFGKHQHCGGFQQFDAELLSQALTAFGEKRQVSKTFYRYSSKGWNLATEEECSRCEYVKWVGEVFSGGAWPDRLPHENDYAAAARAVACIKIIK
jgi:hypothetical protein